MFDENPNMKKEHGIIYLVKFSSPNESFYKVGITKRTLKERFHWGYQHLIMDVIIEHQTTLYDAWRKEQLILNRLKNQRYVPIVKIGGWTECLQADVNLDGLVQTIVE
jgi:hypothetical protein